MSRAAYFWRRGRIGPEAGPARRPPPPSKTAGTRRAGNESTFLIPTGEATTTRTHSICSQRHGKLNPRPLLALAPPPSLATRARRRSGRLLLQQPLPVGHLPLPALRQVPQLEGSAAGCRQAASLGGAQHRCGCPPACQQAQRSMPTWPAARLHLDAVEEFHGDGPLAEHHPVGGAAELDAALADGGAQVHLRAGAARGCEGHVVGVAGSSGLGEMLGWATVGAAARRRACQSDRQGSGSGGTAAAAAGQVPCRLACSSTHAQSSSRRCLGLDAKWMWVRFCAATGSSRGWAVDGLEATGRESSRQTQDRQGLAAVEASAPCAAALRPAGSSASCRRGCG